MNDETKTLDELSDEILFERFRKTLDENCFGVIMERHYSSALALARARLFNKSAAEDIVQETFIRAVRKASSYDSAKPFAPWLYTILKNACTDFIRKEMREHEFSCHIPEDLPDTKTDPQELSFEDIIKALSKTEREIMICRFMRGLSFSEIADECGLPIESVKKKSQRSLKKLRVLMSRKP